MSSDAGDLPDATSVPDADGMPTLGLGTWENDDPEACAAAVETALELGYRHVDTAQIYRNEAAVGEGIASADVDREEVFLATKVWIDSLDYESTIETTRESLDRLGVDGVDLLYAHWPAGEFDWDGTFAALGELVDDGLAERVAVSNFEPEQVERAVDEADVDIFANQFECHPRLPQRELRSTCDDLGVEVVAYSPLARGAVFDDDTLAAIADDNGVSPAQVSLAWLRQAGVTAIPKATSPEHIRDNWSSLSLSLSESELDAIEAIGERDRRVDPGFAPWN